MNHPPSLVPAATRHPHQQTSIDPLDLFDTTRARLLDGANIAEAIDILSDGLLWARNGLPAERWRDVISLARAHPLMGLLQENPFLRRAFAKPRGYAGDAPLIDMMYDGRAAPDAAGASPLGLAMLDRDAAAPGSVAVRERRDFMAELIDDVAETVPSPSILAAASGHLREARLSKAVAARRLGRFVALDQDADALAQVAQDYGDNGVDTVNRSVRAIMDRSFAPASFDLIYAVGLFDCLQDRFAKGLTRACFDLLKPGGRLIIANLVPNIYDAGYYEAFGDWFMIYRNAADMLRLGDLIAEDEAMPKRVYTRRSPDIFYLEIRKGRS